MLVQIKDDSFSVEREVLKLFSVGRWKLDVGREVLKPFLMKDRCWKLEERAKNFLGWDRGVFCKILKN